MKKIENWNGEPIKITKLLSSGNKFSYIKLGDIVNVDSEKYKITALDNDDNVFKAVNINDNNDVVTMYAYEVV